MKHTDFHLRRTTQCRFDRKDVMWWRDRIGILSVPAILGRATPDSKTVITREAKSSIKKRLRMVESPLVGIPIMIPESP